MNIEVQFGIYSVILQQINSRQRYEHI